MVTEVKASAGDITGIKNVLKETWLNTYSSFLHKAAIEEITNEWHAAKVLKREIENNTVYFGVAKETSGHIFGMITAINQEGTLAITRLYVLPSSQRQGIGQALLEAAIKFFPNSQNLYVEVEEKNPVGRAFYTKFGFDEVGHKLGEVTGELLNTVVLTKDVRQKKE